MPKSFGEWKREVDKALLKLAGLTSDDLPDWSYRLAYEASMRPMAVAKKVIKAAKMY